MKIRRILSAGILPKVLPRIMNNHVFSPSYYFKIFNTIIELVVINVMDYLVLLKFAAKMFLYNMSMLRHEPTISIDSSVPSVDISALIAWVVRSNPKTFLGFCVSPKFYTIRPQQVIYTSLRTTESFAKCCRTVVNPVFVEFANKLFSFNIKPGVKVPFHTSNYNKITGVIQYV